MFYEREYCKVNLTFWNKGFGVIIIIILRYPTAKQMILTIILELEKLEASRIEMCSTTTGINRFGKVLQREINWVYD